MIFLDILQQFRSNNLPETFAYRLGSAYSIYKSKNHPSRFYRDGHDLCSNLEITIDTIPSDLSFFKCVLIYDKTGKPVLPGDIKIGDKLDIIYISNDYEWGNNGISHAKVLGYPKRLNSELLSLYELSDKDDLLSLTSIEIPASIKSIHDLAMWEEDEDGNEIKKCCLSDIYYGGKMSVWLSIENNSDIDFSETTIHCADGIIREKSGVFTLGKSVLGGNDKLS